MHEQIIKEIDVAIMKNRVMRRCSTSDFDKDCFRENNDLLGRVRTILKSQKEYERGLNEAWELAKKIGGMKGDGIYTCDELEKIFGYRDPADIADNYSYQEALTKVQAYEKKKEEEAAKPKLGDVVEFYSNGTLDRRGVYLYDDGNEVLVLVNGFPTPQRLTTSLWTLKKTGEHVDIQGMLDKIG